MAPTEASQISDWEAVWRVKVGFSSAISGSGKAGLTSLHPFTVVIYFFFEEIESHLLSFYVAPVFKFFH